MRIGRRVLCACMALTLAACSGGGSGFVHVAPSSAPGAGSPSNYIGTFPLTYSGTVGSCGSSALPTALNITATTQGTNVAGQAVTLLTGNVVGGLFDGVPFANTAPAAPYEQTSYPTAYVLNSTGIFTINVFSGYAPEANTVQEFFLVVSFSNGGAVEVQTSTCNEGADSAGMSR